MKFSITIPAYKRRYLSECLDSCIAQTYSDFEIIIIDDCSPENLKEVVLKYSDNRIKYFRNDQNCGAINVVDNWNKCLEASTGDYIICMGDDDKLKPNALEIYSSLIKKHPGLGVYHGQTEIIDSDSNCIKKTTQRPEYENVYSFIWHRWNDRKNQYIGDFVFDRQILIKNGGFYKLPLAWASDDITAAIAAKENGIANTKEVVFQYRINPFTISKTGQCEIKLKSINLEFNWYKNFLLNNNSDRIKYCNEYYKCLNAIEKHFFSQKSYTIANELKNNHSPKKTIYFFKNKKEFKLNIFTLAKALLLYCFDRI